MTVLSALAAMALTMGAKAAEARAERIPNSRVLIELPGGFEPSTRFTGFEHEDGRSVILFEAPGAAFERMARSLKPETLAARGITEAELLMLERTGRHVALTARQVTAGRIFDKLILLIADAQGTAILTVNIPAQSGFERIEARAEMVRALETARLVQASSFEQGPALSASIDAVAPFILVVDAPPTLQLFATEREAFSDNADRALIPAFVVMSSTAPRPIPSGMRRRFAARAVSVIENLQVDELDDLGEIEIAGLVGFHHRGRGVLAPGRVEVVVDHVTLFTDDGRGYVRMVGVAAWDARREWVPIFRRMQAALRLTGRP
ncbi:MAG: hypothetical protein ACFCUN_09455 [Hyphomicrobiaceae bacterium]